MTLTARIARNNLLQIAGKLAGSGVSLLVVALMTRYLHGEGFGQYATVLAYVAFFSVLADLGISLTAVVELASATADGARALGNLLGMRVVASIGLLLIGAALAFAVPYPTVVRIGIAVTTLTYLFAALAQLLTAVLQVQLRMWPAVVAELAARIVLLAVVIVGVSCGWGLVGILWGHAIAGLCSLAIVVAAARAHVPIRARFDLAEWRSLLSKSLPIGAAVILTFAYGRMDTLILSLLQPADVVGRYAAAYKVLEVTVQFPVVFAGLVLPSLVAARGDLEEFGRLFRGAFEAVTLIGIPVTVTCLVLAEPILRFVAGDEFAAGSGILRILMFASGMLFVSVLSSSAVVALEKQRAMLPGYLLAALAGIALYVALIPRYSGAGAAIGTVVTEAVVLFYSFALVVRTSRVRLRWRGVVRSIPATVLLAAMLAITPSWPLLARLACGASLYLGGLFASRAVPVRFLKDVLALDGGSSRVDRIPDPRDRV